MGLIDIIPDTAAFTLDVDANIFHMPYRSIYGLTQHANFGAIKPSMLYRRHKTWHWPSQPSYSKDDVCDAISNYWRQQLYDTFCSIVIGASASIQVKGAFNEHTIADSQNALGTKDIVICMNSSMYGYLKNNYLLDVDASGVKSLHGAKLWPYDTFASKMCFACVAGCISFAGGPVSHDIDMLHDTITSKVEYKFGVLGSEYRGPVLAKNDDLKSNSNWHPIGQFSILRLHP